MSASSVFRPFLTRRFVGRAALLAVVLVAAVAVSATPSSAMRHLRLVKASPAADTVLAASPDAIRLWLSEPTDPAISKISLATAAGANVPLGKLTLAAQKDAPLEAKLTAKLADGLYAVTWKAMSKDGHVVDGKFSFRVRAAD